LHPYFIHGSYKSSSRADLRSLRSLTSLGEFVIIHGSQHQDIFTKCPQIIRMKCGKVRSSVYHPRVIIFMSE
jgi:hypothetical protein